ncbi:MAG: DUF3108 domain-containing protein [Burkholderiaceae bacterium]|nr:DUF3108 domain-containing protein [Burkholderiaceae bacterium]
MIPRALLLTTLPVLAAHWLVLQGAPHWSPAWDSASTPNGPVFSTRSLPPAAAPTPPPAAVTPASRAATAPRATPPRRPRPQPPAGTVTAAAAPEAIAAQADLPEPPPLADAPGTQAAVPEPPLAETPQAPPAGAETPVPPAPAPDTVALAAAAPSIAAQAPPEADSLRHGLEIRQPGASPGRSGGQAPPAVRIPAPAQLAFDVSGQAKGFHYSARAELRWEHDGQRYTAFQELKAFLVGSRSQRSVGQITAQGLQPERFADRVRNEQAAHFDPAQGRVTFSANTPDAAIGPGAQDRLSVFIQLGALLAAHPERLGPGTQISLTTVGARNADRWTFSIEGPETLDLPAGTTPTVKLLRLPQQEYDQKAELWLAPSLGYLPVRIKLTQSNGDFADLQLRSSSAP